MSITSSLEQDALIVEADDTGLSSLLERGLTCFEQGRYAEGSALFKLARKRLFPDQIHLTAALDALEKTAIDHLQAQQALHEASKRFAETDGERQAQIAAFKKLLPSAVTEATSPSFPIVESQKTSSRQQSIRLLPSLPSSNNHFEQHQVPSLEEGSRLPALYITCFGRFEVRLSDPSGQPVSLCSNVKGQAILRYLIAQPKHRETVDMLMAALWPEETLEVAQRKLRIAISALRCSLNQDFVTEQGGGYILCKGGEYLLNPAVPIHTDVDDFLALYRAGREADSSSSAAILYEKACRMYTGPFLTEDLYAEWAFIRREELSKIYIVMCDRLAEFKLEADCFEEAVIWASAILKVDHCDEEAHRHLIRAYNAQGRRSEALRQYQQCQRILREELGVQPLPETQQLFSMLKR